MTAAVGQALALWPSPGCAAVELKGPVRPPTARCLQAWRTPYLGQGVPQAAKARRRWQAPSRCGPRCFSLEHSIVIERPVSEVFAFQSDPRKAPLYDSSIYLVEAVTKGAEPTDLGAVYRVGGSVSLLGAIPLRGFVDFTTTACSTDRELRRTFMTNQGAGEEVYTFDPVEGGKATRLTWSYRSSVPEQAPQSELPMKVEQAIFTRLNLFKLLKVSKLADGIAGALFKSQGVGALEKMKAYLEDGVGQQAAA